MTPASQWNLKVGWLWSGAYAIAIASWVAHFTSNRAPLLLVLLGSGLVGTGLIWSEQAATRLPITALWRLLLLVGAIALAIESARVASGSLEALIFAGIAFDTFVAWRLVSNVTPSRWLVPGWVVLHTSILALVLMAAPLPLVDVVVFQEDSAAALFSGNNPYAITFPDIYSPEASAAFYGKGISVDGVLQFGYPYTPPSLLMVLPGHLLGDVRWAHLVMLGGAGWFLTRIPRPSALPSAVLFLFSPGAAYVLHHGWTEPVSIFLLAGLVLAATNGSRVVPYLAGVFLASKQYLLAVAPLATLLTKRPLELGPTSRWIGKAILAAGVVTIPFLIWSHQEFMWSVVELQFRQPFRPDSLSLLPITVELMAFPSPAFYPILPFASALIALAIVVWKATPGVASFATGSAFVMLALLLFSKQAFVNYYFFVVSALFCGAAAAESREAPSAEDNGAL